MKKINIILLLIISIFAFNLNAFAASGSLSVSDGSVYVGDSFTVSVNINSAAAWNVHVSSTGPVSGCSINQADATSDAMDTNKTFSETCTATATGTININLIGDVTSTSDGNAENISGSKSVSVLSKPSQLSNNDNNNSNSNSNNNLNSNSNNIVDNRSNNNKIKELSAEGYELVKVDENNYTLLVLNDVTSININATAEDTKAKVIGAGNHDLNVGENNIEIVVTAENESQNIINIKVTRKDGYYLEDLDVVLNNNKSDDINITIKSDTKLNSNDLEKIKNSKKTVKFNYYNEDKSLMYSWIIDGSKIKSTSELLTTVTYDSENKREISKLSNYADGLFINIVQLNNFPKGTKIKLYVGSKYDNNDLVNVYAYVENRYKLELVMHNIKVDNGYIEFDDIEASDYLITMSNIPNSDNVVTTTGKSSSSILPIIVGIICLSVIGIIIVFIIKNKKNKETDGKLIDNNILSTVNQNYGIGDNISTVNSTYNNANINNSSGQNNKNGNIL